jgi:hypothetical protein
MVYSTGVDGFTQQGQGGHAVVYATLIKQTGVAGDNVAGFSVQKGGGGHPIGAITFRSALNKENFTIRPGAGANEDEDRTMPSAWQTAVLAEISTLPPAPACVVM